MRPVTSLPWLLTAAACGDSDRVTSLREMAKDAVLKIEVYRAPRAPDARPLETGTGFLVTPSGLVVTSRHVLTDEPEVVLEGRIGSQRPFELRPSAHQVAEAAAADLVLLEIAGDDRDWPSLAVGCSSLVESQEPVVPLGHPTPTPDHQGTLEALRGIRIVDIGGPDLGYPAWQVNGVLEAGMSGGPVLSRGGRVLGVVRGKNPFEARGFVVPIDNAALQRSIAGFAPSCWPTFERQVPGFRWYIEPYTRITAFTTTFVAVAGLGVAAGALLLPSRQTPSFDIFLSHAPEDALAVRVLVEELRRWGLVVWVTSQQTPHADPLDSLDAPAGLARSRHVLIWLTDHWLSHMADRSPRLLRRVKGTGRREIVAIDHRSDEASRPPLRIDSVLSGAKGTMEDLAEQVMRETLRSRSAVRPPEALDRVGDWRFASEVEPSEVAAIVKATDDGGRSAVVRVFNGLSDARSDDAARKRTRRAFQALEILQGRGGHPFIVKPLARPREARRGIDRPLMWFAMSAPSGRPLDLDIPVFSALSLQSRLEFFRGVVEALAFAHDAGVYHGDLRPPNVWTDPLGDRWAPRLLDFALVPEVGFDELVVTRAGLDATTYVPPEQSRSWLLEAPSMTFADWVVRDLWALGMLLHYVVAGRAHGHPVERQALRQRAYDGDRTPDAVREELEALIGEMLAEDAAMRPATASAVLERVRAVIEHLIGRTSRDRAAAPFRADQTAPPAEFRSEVERAEAARSRGWLALLSRDVRGRPFQWAGLRLVAAARQRVLDYPGARADWEEILGHFPEDRDVKLQLAHVYGRLSTQDPTGEILRRSDALLHEVLRDPATSPEQLAEARGQQARNRKSRWVLRFAREVGVANRRRIAAETNHGPETYEAYANAHRADPREYWPGLGAIQAGVILLDLWMQDGAFADRPPVETMLEGLDAELAQLEASVRAALQTAGVDDEWARMTMADLAFATGRPDDEVTAAYHRALDGLGRQARATVWDSAEQQLRLFGSLGIRAELAASLQERFAPDDHLILFVGHRVDHGDGPARFPASQLDAARERMREVATRLDRMPGQAISIASAAPGADLLWHEVCLELGIPIRVVLPMPREVYAETAYEAGMDERWARTLQTLVERASQPGEDVEILELGDRDGMPSWLDTGDDPWVRGNRWVMQLAQDWGASHITLVAFWDESAPDRAQPGGTAHMVELAETAGNVDIEVIDSRRLLRGR